MSQPADPWAPATPSQDFRVLTITALEADFTRLGMPVALNHYRQAVKNFVEEDFEAANGQLRAMIESVLIHFAAAQGFQQTRQGDGGRAIAYLRDRG